MVHSWCNRVARLIQSTSSKPACYYDAAKGPSDCITLSEADISYTSSVGRLLGYCMQMLYFAIHNYLKQHYFGAWEANSSPSTPLWSEQAMSRSSISGHAPKNWGTIATARAFIPSRGRLRRNQAAASRRLCWLQHMLQLQEGSVCGSGISAQSWVFRG